jgi:hypothetical protein
MPVWLHAGTLTLVLFPGPKIQKGYTKLYRFQIKKLCSLKRELIDNFLFYFSRLPSADQVLLMGCKLNQMAFQFFSEKKEFSIYEPCLIIGSGYAYIL